MKEREMKRVDGTDYALWFEAVFRRRKELCVSEAVGKTDARWTGRKRSEVVVVVGRRVPVGRVWLVSRRDKKYL